jgi:glycosyltransferase involved in cell wall biosynthesis
MSFARSFNSKSGTDQGPPIEVLKLASDGAAAKLTPDEAASLIGKLRPFIEAYREHEEFAVNCALLVEKLRDRVGMLEFWSSIHVRFPTSLIAVKLMMRWFRRLGQFDEGLQRLYQVCPAAKTDPDQAEIAFFGLIELKATSELDALMESAFANIADARNLRLRYAKFLLEYDRVGEARKVIEGLGETDNLGSAARTLVEKIRHFGQRTPGATLDRDTLITRIVALAGRNPRPIPGRDLGGVVLFTGQLGAGGAERQMTRIATELHARHVLGIPVGGRVLRQPVQVCVRHASAHRSADFFLPTLREGGVKTTILADVRDPTVEGLGTISAELLGLMAQMPEDLRLQCRKLVPYFTQNQIDVAYLWQDGGVLAAAIAALIARVPRIAASFRGLPPNLRPELMRPEMPALFRALARLPQVVISTNSRTTARAYEDWLGLARGSIQVVYNACPDICADGDPQDELYWSGVVEQSPRCTKTVLGVFRFDPVKRPKLWAEVAARYCLDHPDTRFVVLGSGFEMDECRNLVAAHGIKDQIFFAGMRRNVGFYMHRADILLHLARMEGLPNVVIEAQLAGRAVLATPAGGTGEVIRDGETGVLLSSAEGVTSEEILAALARILENPATLARMGRAARECSATRFKVDAVLDETIKLFCHKA